MRLTNKTRESIVESWTKKKWEAKFTKAVQAIVKDLRKGVTCLTSEIEVEAETLAHLVEKMVVVKESQLGVPRWSKYSDFEFAKGLGRPFSRSLPCDPYYARYNVGSSRVEPSEKQWKRITDLKAKYDAEKRQIEAVLYSVTTDKKLFELLPECQKYMPKIEAKKSTQLIAVDQVKQAAALL